MPSQAGCQRFRRDCQRLTSGMRQPDRHDPWRLGTNRVVPRLDRTGRRLARRQPRPPLRTSARGQGLPKGCRQVPLRTPAGSLPSLEVRHHMSCSHQGTIYQRAGEEDGARHMHRLLTSACDANGGGATRASDDLAHHLSLHQLPEQAALLQELLVGSLLTDAAIVDHEDPVAMLHRRQTVGDHDAGALELRE